MRCVKLCLFKLLSAGDSYSLKTTSSYFPSSSQYILISTTEIYEIKESSKVSGKGIFYLKINEDAVYTYYYKQKDGGYKYESVPVQDTVIYENENSKPMVKTYSTYTKNNWSTFLTKILFFSSKQDKLISERYEIYVPKGSIIKESAAET